MRKVLIYFQDDRARRHQQKGRPPCGHPRTTRTIRKGQRGRLPRARRGSRGQSRSYVVGRAQVRLAFSHLALPLPLFLSFFYSRVVIIRDYYSLCVFSSSSSSSPRPAPIFYATHANARANHTRISLPPSLLSQLAALPSKRTLFVTRYSALTYTACTALDRIETHGGGTGCVIEDWLASKSTLLQRMRCRG